MLLAVYMPLQDPQVGQHASSHARTPASSRVPAVYLPTASNIVERLIPRLSPPGTCPASIGPPETKMHGIFNLRAAISIPGTILSQFGTNTRASNGCAVAMISTLSAINSREQREISCRYVPWRCRRIPRWKGRRRDFRPLPEPRLSPHPRYVAVRHDRE